MLAAEVSVKKNITELNQATFSSHGRKPKLMNISYARIVVSQIFKLIVSISGKILSNSKMIV